MKDLKVRFSFLGVDRVSGMVGGIGSASKKAGSLVAQTTKTLKEQRRELSSVEREMREGTGNLTALIDRERELTAAIDRGNRELEQRKATFDRLSNAQKRYERSQAIGDKMVSGGTKMVATGVAIGAAPVAGVKSAMDMEEGMAGVAKVTNMDPKNLALMNQELLDMSTRIPMAATGMADIAAAAGAAGIGSGMKDQRQQLAAFTEDAAKMGIAFDMTAEEAGSTMAKWRTAFSMTQPQVRALGDQVNALTNKFGGSAAAVTGIITRIGPLGKVAGLGAKEVAALGSTLNSIGVEEEIAATGIKSMMLTLVSGEAATKDQGKAFKALGLDAVKVSKDMQKNASGTIVNVMDRIKKLSPDKQASLLSELFGKESVGAIAPLLTNLDGVRERLGLVGDQAKYAGSMNKEFLSRISTTKGATGLAMNALAALNIEMGQKLLPYVLMGANKIRELVNNLRAWAKANPDTAAGLMRVVGALAGFMIAVGGLGVAGGVGLKAFSMIRLGITMIGGPITQVPKLFGLVRIAATGMWSGVAKGAGIVGRVAPIAFNVVRIGATAMSSGVVKAAMLVGRVAPIAFNAIRVGAMVMAQGVMRAGMMLLTNPIFLIGAAIAGVAYLVYANWDKITAAFTKGVDWVSASWTSLKGYFSNGVAMVSGVFSSLGARINTAWTNVKAAFNTGLALLQGLLPSFRNIGSMIMEGLLSMLSPSRLAARLWNMGKLAIVAFKNVLGIKSPSRVFAGLGGFMTQGLAQGLDRGAGAPIRSARSLGTAAALAAAVPIVATPSLASVGVGRAGVAKAAAPAANAQRASAPGTAASPLNVTINVYQQPGQDGRALAGQIREELKRIERENRLSTYRDWGDYGDG